MRYQRKKKGGRQIDWKWAPDIKKRILNLSKTLDLNWIITSRIFCFRSNYSSSRAYARIWGLSRVWQLALKIKPSYIIEVLSERFDKLSFKDQDRVLLHEIAHIPNNFSGALLPHVRRGKRNFEDRVKSLMLDYTKSGRFK
jgi:predicted metallopeptidase